MSIQFTFITANGSGLTSSFSAVPINYPTVTGSYILSSEPVTASASPASLSLADNTYKIEYNDSLANNNWYINVISGSASLYSGSAYSGSLSTVTFDLANHVEYPLMAYEVDIKPVYKNVWFNGNYVSTEPLSYTTSNTGTFTASLVPMPYNVYVKSFVKNTCFAILPTSSCNANSCIITSASVCPIITPQNKAIYAYPAAISDARYILSGSISGGGVSYPDITDNTSSQYVGIVQTNPQYTLDVNGTVAASSIISDSITNTNGDALTIDSTGILQLDSTYQINLLAGSVYSINLHSGYDANIYAQQGFNVHCYTSSAFLSTPIGFGINQSNPQYTLDVNGQIGNSFYNNNNYIILDDGNGNSAISTIGSINLNSAFGYLVVNNESNKFILDTNCNLYDYYNNYYLGVYGNNSFLNAGGGNLGIGTSTPENLLDVVYGSIGGMDKGTYEVSSFERNGDTKVGIYNSSGYGGSFANGASLVFGDTGFTDSNGLYTGFETQFTYDADNNQRLIRYNSLGRDSSGVVQYAVANILTINDIAGSGMIGINTPVPSYTLDVVGSINFTGNLLKNGSAYVPANASTASIATVANQMPYSSSAYSLTPTLATGSMYFSVSGSVNLLHIYNGSRWTSSSLA